MSALSGQLVVYAFGFATSILIARAVGAEGRGAYYLPVTAAAVAVTLASIGLETANSVSFAERRASLAQLSRNASVMALILGPPATALCAIAFSLNRDGVFGGVSEINFVLIAATIPFSLHLLWITNLFLLAKRIARYQLALVIGAAFQFVGATALSALDRLGLTEIVLLYDASVLIPWLLLIVWAGGLVAPTRPALDRSLMRQLAAFGLKFYPGLLLWYLLLRFDVFLIGHYLSTVEVGIYSLAVLFAELAWLLTNPLAQAAVPFQAELDITSSGEVAFKAARFNLAFALILSGIFAASLWWVIPGLYGPEFRDAYQATLALLPGIVAMAAARPLTLVLARRNRPLLYNGVTVGAFAANFGLNILWLPSLGINGASIASSIAYIMLAGIFILWSLRITGMKATRALAPRREDLKSLTRAVTRIARAMRRP